MMVKQLLSDIEDFSCLPCRRDSFITHRAFCDALAEESARVNHHMPCTNGLSMHGPGGLLSGTLSPTRSAIAQIAGGASLINHLPSSRLGGATSQLDNGSSMSGLGGSHSSRPRLSLWLGSGPNDSQMLTPDHIAMDPFPNTGSSVASLFGSMDTFDGPKPLAALNPNYGSLMNVSGVGNGTRSSDHDIGGLSALSSLPSWPDKNTGNRLSPHGTLSGGLNVNVGAGLPSLINGGLASLPSVPSLLSQASGSSSAQMSATALLQKAAQMGATASNNSLLKGFANMAGCDTGTSSWSSSTPQMGSMGPLASMMMQHNNPLQAQSSFMQQKEQASALLAMMKGSNISQQAAHQGSLSQGIVDNASIQEMLSSMGPSNLLTSNMPTSISHLFSMSSENQNPNQLPPFPINPREHQHQFSLSSESGQHQQQAKLKGLMGYGRTVPKSEDGITRDFLGVRGVNTLVGPQDAAMAKSLSQQQRDSLSSMYPALGVDHYNASPREGFRSLTDAINSHSPSPGRSWADKPL